MDRIYIAYKKESGKIMMMKTAKGQNALCFFESEEDAERTILSWGYDLDEWEIDGSNDSTVVLSFVSDIQEGGIEHGCFNPPIAADRKFKVFELSDFVDFVLESTEHEFGGIT